MLGVAVLASVFSTMGGYGSPSAFVDGLTWALWIGAAMVGLRAVTALGIQGRKATLLRHVAPSSSSDLLIGGERSAPGILERFANGEIDREEFERAGHPQTLPGGR